MKKPFLIRTSELVKSTLTIFFILLEKSLVSPYINRFLQPDTLIPGAANPQNLNRYGYVLNNPIRSNDPTGHVCTDPEDPTPTCYGSPAIQTKVGNVMVRGNGAELKNLSVNEPKQTTPKGPDPVEDWEYDANVEQGIHIGPTQDYYSPDFNGDIEENHNVPYIPGISPGGAPNACKGSGATAGPALALCFVSFATSFAWPAGPANVDPNFFLAYHVNYSNQSGLTVSDVQFKSLYGGQAAIEWIKINNHVEYQSPYFLTANGQYRPISTSGGSYHGNGSISIDIRILYTVNLSNGPGVVPQIRHFVVPSIDNFKSFMGLK